MAKQYWVGDYFIDLSRNQITQNGQSQTIAPKALAVLTYLAENQGTVVSQDALLDRVWQDTAVTANTLQRSIAQLRKALGEDSKVQFYIKTHAKQGYSLECDVRWHDNHKAVQPKSTKEKDTKETQPRDAGSGTIIANTPKNASSTLKPILITAGMIAIGFIGYLHHSSQKTSQLTFDRLRSLTATDDKEFDPTYSPDGQYIVFHRYFDKQCINKIWAKSLGTQQEVPLTKDWGNYGSHSFSKDGKKLIFLATEACSKPVCYNLMSLDFEKALTSPQIPDLILQCKNSEIKSPTWLSNNDIALLQKSSNRWKLINYSVRMDRSTDLYNLKEGNLINFAYSWEHNLISVISIHSDGKQYIEMLNPNGKILSSHLIELPQEIPKFRLIFPNFDPLNKQLIFSTGRQLFTLSYDGKVTKISLPFADRMALPEFHPNGRRLLLIKGPYDSDIVLLNLNQIPKVNSLNTQIKAHSAYTSFERSNLGENYAIFQPGGELIAFWSERSGEQQLWISDGNGPQQLTNFPMDTYIRGLDWAEDGQSLLVNANGVLTQVFLNSNQKPFPFEHAVVQLFQWDSKKNSALLLARIKGIIKLVDYDLNHSTIRELSDQNIKWALRSDEGRLIYKDHLNQFWQPGPAEAELIEPLEKQAGKADIFVIKENVIYAINTENRLWSYNLTNGIFKILGEVSEGVDYLTDINQTHVLMTIVVSAKKEVVELSLSE